jgi:hypothetical protein
MVKRIRKLKLTSAHYQLIASIIRMEEDEAFRVRMAMTFGKAFQERSSVFDFYLWRKACNME